MFLFCFVNFSFSSVLYLFLAVGYSASSGDQSGRDKLRPKFSRTAERNPGMLLLTNQFHDSFERLSLTGHKKYIFCAQSEASIHSAVATVRRTCLARAGEQSKLEADITISC